MGEDAGAWSGMYSRIGEDCKKVEGWVADRGIGEGEGQTWLLQSRSSLFCIWRMNYGASSSRPSWSFCTRPIRRINTRHLHSRNRTHPDYIDAPTRNQLDPHFSVPNPAPTVVPIWGDDREKTGTVVSYGLEWDGEGEHRGYGFIHASEKLWWYWGMSGWRGRRVCSVGEQVIGGAMVVESARLIRMWVWMWKRLWKCAWFGGGY